MNTSHQTEIHQLQSDVKSFNVTVQKLGQFITQMVEKNHNIEMPGEIRRIVQQINNSHTENRKKPVFTDRKIGKSMSVNAQLGFPLKVLEELNESAGDSPIKSSKTQFFENTYQQIRQQNQIRPTCLDGKLVDGSNVIKLPSETNSELKIMISPVQVDSGIATPISPPTVAQPVVITDTETIPVNNSLVMHPFSNCEDVNFKFNGTTTQLKSIRPINRSTKTGTTSITNNVTDSKNGRS